MDHDQIAGTLHDSLWPHLRDALGALGEVRARQIVQWMIENEEGGPIEVRRSTRPKEDHRSVEKSLNEEGVYYALKRDDLRFIREAADGMTILADLVWTKGVAFAVKLLAYLVERRRNWVRLDVAQAFTLIELEAVRGAGATVEDLVKRTGVPQQHVLHALESMQSMRREDGRKTSLVECENGQWFAQTL